MKRFNIPLSERDKKEIREINSAPTDYQTGQRDNNMTIQEFADRVYQDRLKIYGQRYKHLDPDFEAATRVVPGRKYDKVDVGPRNNWSGKFMVTKAGEIYGIKAYGVIHKGKRYGTLNTVDEYFWGHYSPVRRATP